MESIGQIENTVMVLHVPIENKAHDMCGVQVTLSMVSGNGDVDNYELLVDVTFRDIPKAEKKEYDLDVNEVGLNVPKDCNTLEIVVDKKIHISGCNIRR